MDTGVGIYHGSPIKPTFFVGFVVNNLVFRCPKPVFFMVLGAHGTYIYPVSYPVLWVRPSSLEWSFGTGIVGWFFFDVS